MNCWSMPIAAFARGVPYQSSIVLALTTFNPIAPLPLGDIPLTVTLYCEPDPVTDVTVAPTHCVAPPPVMAKFPAETPVTGSLNVTLKATELASTSGCPAHWIAVTAGAESIGGEDPPVLTGAVESVDEDVPPVLDSSVAPRGLCGMVDWSVNWSSSPDEGDAGGTENRQGIGADHQRRAIGYGGRIGKVQHSGGDSQSAGKGVVAGEHKHARSGHDDAQGPCTVLYLARKNRIGVLNDGQDARGRGTVVSDYAAATARAATVMLLPPVSSSPPVTIRLPPPRAAPGASCTVPLSKFVPQLPALAPPSTSTPEPSTDSTLAPLIARGSPPRRPPR